MNLESSAAETSFVNENFSDSSPEEHDNDDDDESEPASFSRSDGTDVNDLDAEDKQADDYAPRGIHQNVRQADKAPLRKKSKASTQEIRKNQVHQAWFVSDSTWNKCFNRCARQKISTPIKGKR